MKDVLNNVQQEGMVNIPFNQNDQNLKAYLNIREKDLKFLEGKKVNVIISTKENYYNASYKAYHECSNFLQYRDNPEYDFFLIMK